MPDDMFADDRPFFEIRRHAGAVFFGRMFDLAAEAVEDFGAALDDLFQITVGRGEIIRARCSRYATRSNAMFQKRDSSTA